MNARLRGALALTASFGRESRAGAMIALRAPATASTRPGVTKGLAGFAALLGILACGCADREGYGCISPIEGVCHQYVSSDEDVLDESKRRCSERGEGVADSCPTEGLVGCCSTETDTDAVYNCFYAPTHTVSETRSRCDDMHFDFTKTFYEEEDSVER